MELLRTLAEHAETRASAPAIEVRGDVVLDYEALWHVVRALAEDLRATGVGPEQVVALALPRSPELVVAMLATWCAGGAFVVLAAHDPPARRARILGELAPRRVLDQVSLAALRTRVPAPQPALSTPADQLAYVVYTSGSTGEPKGIRLTHAGLPALITTQRRAFQLTPDARVLWVLAPSFDASLSDVTTTLSAGATLCLEGASALDPQAFLATLAQRRITHVDLPPALLSRLEPAAAPPCLRTLVIGGEVCPQPVVRAWASRVNLVNVYGPSEATICATWVRCAPSWDSDALGEPVPGLSLRVLDAGGQDADEGELLLVGPAVARGYVGRPELDAARFGTYAGQRSYRTGDRVRRGARGEWVFVGRLDRQLKLHGQRVELGEIEQALAECAGVHQAAVVAAGPATLVAFVVGSAPEPELRAALARRLPPYMIPAHLVPVAVLPTTAHGKLDHAALEALARARADAPASASSEHGRARDDTSPDELEQRLVQLWRALLGGPSPTRDSHFFACGGDSYTALTLAARLAEHGLTLPPAAVYQHPTLGAQAALLRASPALDVRSTSALEPLAAPTFTVQSEARRPHVVLLTGATGNLGRALLDQLLRSSFEVHALVRATADAEAVVRLHEPRARAWSGDLRAPRLGLRPEDWRHLVGRVDTVVHAAAEVNLVRPYEALAPANVGGTRELLALAAEARAIVHHISTLSVFVATDRRHGVVYEDDRLEDPTRVWGGYAQSKWVAERLVRASAPEARIYRLGLVTGDTKRAHTPPAELLGQVVRGLHALGRAPVGPRSARLALDVTPLDRAVAALAELITHAPPGTYHLASPAPLTLPALLEALDQARGTPLMREPEATWLATPPSPHEPPDARVARLALSRLALDEDVGGSSAHHDAWRTLDLFQATGVRFDARRTRSVLGRAPIEPPTADMVVRYVRAILARNGAVASPSAHRR